MTVAWILKVLECGRMLPRSVGMKKMTLIGGEKVLRNPCRLARLNEGRWELQHHRVTNTSQDG